MIELAAVGWKAHAVLVKSGGEVRRLATLGDSAYVTAAGEILWLGPRGGALHPRAMLAPNPRLEGDRAWIDTAGLVPWRPKALPRGESTAPRLVAGCSAVLAKVHQLGAPQGLGILLRRRDRSDLGTTDRRDSDPFLDRAIPAARALGRACRAGDAVGAIEPATALLGLGPGLTPAGDDFVGGALFARALLSRVAAPPGVECERGTPSCARSEAPGSQDAWNDVVVEIVRRATERTHPISAALLGDLVAGDGPAALHALVGAMIEPGARDAPIDAARAVVDIGHSSGWDVLAGFIAALVAI